MNLNKVYRGVAGDPEKRDVPFDNVRVVGRKLNPRTSLRNHSPGGFAWGYEGSGPAQLALAILMDFMPYDQKAALRLYQEFKFEVIAKFPIDKSFELTGKQIAEWLTSKEIIDV